MVLTLQAAGLSAEDIEDLVGINSEIAVIAERRLTHIDLFAEPYRRSKIAWKIALFTNAMAHRFIALAEGVALSWNHGNTLSAVLNARAIVETTAIYYEFGELFSKSVRESDFAKIDGLAMRYLFSTREEALLEEHPELKAPHVLKAIDLIDKTLIPNFRSHYDRLSERCHPNSAGHRTLFSKLDRETGLTAFSASKDVQYIHPIKCALGTAVVFRQVWDSVDEDIHNLAAAHHAAYPSPFV